MEKLSELIGRGIKTYELSVGNLELAARLVQSETVLSWWKTYDELVMDW